MNRKIILTVGASCSGKSTWAERFVEENRSWANINRDTVRFCIHTNGIRDWTRYKFNSTNEKQVTDRCDKTALKAVELGYSIIISDTSLNPKIRNKWKEFAEKHNYEYEEKPFEVDWDTLRERNAQREGGISESLLRQQYLRMKEYLGHKKYTPDISLPKAFLCDIDGNVAICGDRGYFDWDKVHVDKPREVVIAMVHGLIDAGYIPIFLSGRDSVCKDITYDWIMEHIMQWYLPENGGFHLFMREKGDMRKDHIVKRELFEKYVENKFNVCAVLDDRPRVINNCWNELGLPNVIATADQLLEF